MDSKRERLESLLYPLLSEKETRIESFLEEDLEWYVAAVCAFHVEEEVLRYVSTHPNATAQELYHLIPEGLPPGEDGSELLAEDD